MAPLQTKVLLMLVAPALLCVATVLSASQNTTPTPLSAPKFKPELINERVSNRIIVRYKPEEQSKSGGLTFTPGEERVKALNASGFTSVVRQHPTVLEYIRSITPQTHVVNSTQRLNRLEMLALARNIAQDPNVEHAEVDEIAYPQFVPNDADFSAQQWNLKAPSDAGGGANVPTIWDYLYDGIHRVNGTGVIVAVLDSGYRPHADLAANIIGGYDFVSADTGGGFATANDGDGRDASPLDPGDWVATASSGCPVRDSIWHGTHVAGVISAAGNNNAGIIGLAYGAKVLPVRVLGVCGGYTSDIVAGMRWAAGLSVAGVPANTNIAKVINLSLGSTGECGATYQAAINEIRNAPGGGSVVVVSTGNGGATSLNQPSNCKGVIAATAHTKIGDNAEYANIGVGTALSAPGGGYGYVIPGDGSGIYSTANAGMTGPTTDNFVSYAGTSFSAAHVSAAAALLYQVKPAITPDEVMSSLVNSTRPHPVGTYCHSRWSCGTGMLDADAAVHYALGNTPFTSASSNAVGVVASGTTVTLTGIATTGNFASPITSVGWTQLSGPTVTLTGASTSVATFVVPTIPSGSDGALYFQFRATNAVGQSDSRVGVQATVPVTTSSSSTTNSSSSGSGGSGGGGSTGWLEVTALLMLALTARWCRPRDIPTPAQVQKGRAYAA